MKRPKPRREPVRTCPNVAQHTPMPDGYINRYEFAQKMLKTHKQVKCQGCGIWEIWRGR